MSVSSSETTAWPTSRSLRARASAPESDWSSCICSMERRPRSSTTSDRDPLPELCALTRAIGRGTYHGLPHLHHPPVDGCGERVDDACTRGRMRPVHAHHHGHGHGGHAHGHRGSASAERRRGQRGLLVALCLTLSIFAVEVVGGLAAGSLALLADAGHVLADAIALALALAAGWLAGRPAGDRRTFGWQRVEILVAFGN